MSIVVVMKMKKLLGDKAILIMSPAALRVSNLPNHRSSAAAATSLFISLFLLSPLFLQLSSGSGNPEVDALAALKNNLTDPDGYLQSWDPSLKYPCTWFHVTCTQVDIGNVTRIDLGSSHLSGRLVPDLAKLNDLQYLALYENDISGEIPLELGNLTNLVSLDLYNNKLTGMLPALHQFTKLVFMRLNNNLLSDSIFVTIQSLTALQILDLSNNQFSGSLLMDFTLMTSLSTVNFSNNKLTGPIPPELGSIKTLDLSRNYLTGRIPRALASISYVDLSSNCLDLTDNPFSDPRVVADNNNPARCVSVVMRMFLLLSSSLLLLSSLSVGNDEGDALMAVKNILNDPNNVLESWNNATSPSSPCANQPWDYIQCGSFKDGIGGPMYDSVTDIIITNANLSGQLPQLLHHLAKLPNLKTLNLRRNNIGGVIPPEVGNFTSLLRLSLDYNQLTGPIPNSILDQAPRLQALSLKNNGLSGKIPDSLDKLATLYTLRPSGVFCLRRADARR
ncbi:unnamed protein product [Cuscuta campestris]|uniref:Leucine-rich repeat-containing N-terminal plant-type domain-containing protein n=1 Tax=Cuscuta campestris TaxID=132261 RepID=A0A484MJ67_9ASTE|nr:unnamed protein product [Cuscuta campestris]